MICLQSNWQASLSAPGNIKEPGAKVMVSNTGWTITVDSAKGILNIKHDSLGILIRDVRLNIKRSGELVFLKDWSAEKTGTGQVAIPTVSPFTYWIFSPDQNSLTISCTSSEVILTAEAPAPNDRIVARLIDSRGVPVNWTGTNEITGSWKGKNTRNQSYLPVKNPEVMTFGMGQVSASNMHCLFDRKNDIAIIFSDNTLMQRNPLDQDLLDITITVPGNMIIRLIPDYYTRILGLPSYTVLNDKVFPSAPVIWGSWTAYYYEARESDIVSNTDWLAANLKPYGFQYVQIDDGYDRGKPDGHYWIENWNKTLFPNGPEWLAKYIKSEGLRPGIWLVPNSYAGAFRQHPVWYLYDKSGNPIKDCGTPALDY